MILALWLLSLPFRLLAALGLRRSVILACLFVLAITASGVAQDLGLLEPPARAAPARRPTAGQPSPSRAAVADIPTGYLRLYRTTGARYRVPWSVLAAIGKVESDHGRSRLPGCARGATGPGPVGPCSSAVWRAAGPATPGPATATAVSMTRPTPSRPRPVTWSTTAPAATSTGRSTPITTPGPMWPRSSSSPAATPVGVGGGERPHHLPPRSWAGLD
jgi:hypothetical protein